VRGRLRVVGLNQSIYRARRRVRARLREQKQCTEAFQRALGTSTGQKKTRLKTNPNNPGSEQKKTDISGFGFYFGYRLQKTELLLLKDARVWDAPRASRIREPSLRDAWLKKARAKLCSATVPGRPKRRIGASRHAAARVRGGVRFGAGLAHRLQRPLHPSRTGSNLALFDLAPSPTSVASSSHDDGPAASSGSAQPAASPYCTLLRIALFGPDTLDRVASSAAACSSPSSSSPGPSPVGTPATWNIFRFKTEVRRNAKRALFSGDQEEDALFPGIFTTRGAGPRKVPRSPYKVRWGIRFAAFLIGPSLFLGFWFLR
jgi:hypothetical protein